MYVTDILKKVWDSRNINSAPTVHLLYEIYRNYSVLEH